MVLSHLHSDHVDGLPGVLRGRSVAAVQVGPLGEPAERAQMVREVTRAAGVPLVSVQFGEQRRVGDLSWEVVWPARVIRGEESVPNNASIVLLAEIDGVRLLLTGDVEPLAQRALLGNGTLGPVDVLKVPHHGSAHQAPGLLAAADPRVAVVSVGADNDYGHPAQSTLDDLTAGGALIARTDRDGDIAIVGPADRLRVVRRDG